MEEEIEHIKDLKKDLDYIVENKTLDTEVELLNAHRKSMAISFVLNELEKLQKENEDWQRAYQEEKDEQFNMLIKKCGHCGKETPLYCETCYQELISKNAELQSDNYEIKNTYRRIAQHLNNIGKTELADYMLAQINDVPVWCVGDDKNFIPKQVIRDELKDIELAIAFCENENRFKELIIKKGCLKELLGE